MTAVMTYSTTTGTSFLEAFQSCLLMKPGARRRMNASCFACPGRISRAPVLRDPLDPSRSALTDFAALADDQTGAILFLLTGIAFVPICIFIRKREILGI